MIEFLKWISIFVLSGAIAGCIYGIGAARSRVFYTWRWPLLITGTFIVGLGSWLVASFFSRPPPNTITLERNIDALSGPLIADVNVNDYTMLLQGHSIRIDVGRSDRPITVEYRWTAPRVTITLPEEAAAFITGAGSKDMKISGAPGCPETIKGRVSEIPACAHRDSDRQFLFTWLVHGLGEPQEITLVLRLGATAVNGSFETQQCTPLAGSDTNICGAKKVVDHLSPAGDSILVTYGDEQLEGRSWHAAKSKDGAITLDATNGIVTLKASVRNAIGLTNQQLSLLTLLGTILGALLGNGIIFALIALRNKAAPAAVHAPIRPPGSPPGYGRRRPSR